jgi:4-amino-4-deoxy-L-arabinose transferase-like glycosyltransferase
MSSLKTAVNDFLQNECFFLKVSLTVALGALSPRAERQLPVFDAMELPGYFKKNMNLSHLSREAVRHRNLLLVLLGVLLYVAFLGLRDVWYPDEPDIAEVARAMFLSGDWISPRRMGEIWVDYPPMIYWAGTISSHLMGGMSAFSLRLPNALAAIGIVLVTSAAGKRWFDARTGLWAGFCLLTFLSFVYEANSYRPDVLFTLTITAGIVTYAEGAGDRPRVTLRALAFVFLGLAMLAKGPLGLLLPGLVLVLWLGARREWRRIAELAPLSLLSVAIYLSWFAANARAMGWDTMLHEFYAQNFERFLTSEYRGHAQPWLYYFRNFWIDFAPWSWLFPPAIWWLVRSRRWRDPRVQLALWWFGAFLVFLSLAATKRQVYLLPAYPAVALLLGPWMASAGQGEGRHEAPAAHPVNVVSFVMAIAYSIVGLALIGMFAKYGSIVSDLNLNDQAVQVAKNIRIPLVLLGIALLASGLWIGQAWRRGNVRTSLVRLGGAHVGLYVVILALVMPAFGPTKSYEPQSRWISEQIGDATHFGMVDSSGVARRGGFAYYTGTMVDLLESRAEVERFFQEHPGSVVLVAEESADRIFAGKETVWKDRTLRKLRVGSHLYVVVDGPKSP